MPTYFVCSQQIPTNEIAYKTFEFYAIPRFAPLMNIFPNCCLFQLLDYISRRSNSQSVYYDW